jgi:hypothetical protein
VHACVWYAVCSVYECDRCMCVGGVMIDDRTTIELEKDEEGKRNERKAKPKPPNERVVEMRQTLFCERPIDSLFGERSLHREKPKNYIGWSSGSHCDFVSCFARACRLQVCTACGVRCEIWFVSPRCL